MNAKKTKKPRPPEFHPHTSTVLQDIIRDVPSDTFTLRWMMGHLPKHSFGIILLFLAMLSFIPVVSIVARLLILLLIMQIILGYHSPVLPRRLIDKKMSSRYLTRLNRHAIPALKHLEHGVKPRWVFLLSTRRFTAFIALLLTLFSLLSPIPFANVPPAAISVMMALAFIEHDGLLLSVALAAAIILLGILTLTIFVPSIL